MGDNLYTSYWQSILPRIIEQLKEGKQIVQLEVKELANYGDRTKGYYANFRIVNGKLEISNNAYAQGRDLYAVLIQDEYFTENLVTSTLQVTISKGLQLKMEILASSAPDFFTEEDFTELSKFAEIRMDKENRDHRETYEFLRGTYAKTAYWARQVQEQIFPNGFVHIIQKPTNQASIFEYYQWAKIYPDKASLNYKALAFTVGIETDNRFTIKIDTVGLFEADIRRQSYLKTRGDHEKSAIVKHLANDQVLDKGWKYLIDLTANIILTLNPSFDSLLQSFQGNPQPVIVEEPIKNIAMALNTILYGPPGTGKTYKLQSLCNNFIITKAVQTRQEFLEHLISNLTWWETVGAAMMQLKSSSVPALEKHEFIKIKASQSTTIHVKQVLWGSLQAHTDLDCKNVKFTNRIEPLLFSKDANSVWTVLEERVQNEAPEIISFLNEVKNFKPESGSVQKNYRMVTFHQSFSYEDFIEGIKPVFNKFTSEELEYEIQKGVFFQCCNDAAKLAGYDSLYDCINDTKENRKKKINAAPPYALFIDEVNRANVSAVFGELITLIEDDKRLGMENEITNITLPYSKIGFGVPGNLHIIGTMNTADRSVEALDTALRRRFTFEQMLPDESLLSSQNLIVRLYTKYPETDWNDKVYRKDATQLYSLIGIDPAFEKNIRQNDNQAYADDDKIRKLKAELFTGVNLQSLLSVVNKRLEALLTKDHTIGHAWLMNVYSLGDLQEAFKNKILPLLQEFFYNDYAKIGLVLGDTFVQQKQVGKNRFANFKDTNELSADYEEKIIYTLIDPANIDLNGFKSIYK